MANLFPGDLRYTEDHEWIRVHDDGTATIGITDYAQEALGDIVFVELPEVDDTLAKGKVFGAVESVKTTSDIYMPASGTVVAINEDLVASPEILNAEPHGKGWLIKIELSDASEVEGLMDAGAYAEHVANQDH